MRCAQCGVVNSPPQRYCGGCGAALVPEPACPACGSGNPAGQNYCGACGADLRRDEGTTDAKVAAAIERRHLTVMFCDLAGSTAMSEQLDPEELGEVILAYREIVAEAIARLDGYVARYVGDGILIYFGYPRAHGDDPTRAVHAAMAVLAAMQPFARTLKATKGITTSVRMGVHTGLVVVGEFARGAVREVGGVVGETPNLAARLIDLAPPGSVLVSGVTHALIKNEFQCREIGATRLKGLSRPIHIYEVMRAHSQQTRIEFNETMEITTLAGREHELQFLRDRWRQVIEGAGQVVSVVGEPGIGKSRLVRAFGDGLGGSDHLKIVFHCSPHFSNSALFPVIDYLHRWLESTSGDKLERLADSVAALKMSPVEVVPIIASLVSIPITAPYEAPQVSAKAQRDRTMEFLLEWLVRQAADRPTLLVIEDLHWSDASTIELILLLLNQIYTARILLLVTFRPEFHPQWPMYSHLAHLPLDRLTAAQVQEMIGHLTKGKHLPEFVCNHLIEKTDGVPLFVEELTKAVIESDILTEDDQGYQLRSSPLDVEIPITLHATLMARLDGLNSAKLVAQRAAVIGREFSYDLLAAITTLSEDDLTHGLSQLVEAELLFQRGLPPRASYLFKHSMIQETAYRSLLRANRLRYHRQIAEVLISDFAQIAVKQPELVAFHFSSARMATEAAGYWRRAGEQALARSANLEALAHINRGLGGLATCPKSSLRTREEVTLLVALGAALTASKGYGAPEVAQTYARARELCQELDDPSHLFPVLRGLHSFYLVHGPLGIACEMVEQLGRMAEQTGNSLQRVEAHRRLGWCLFCMGKLEAGQSYLGKAIGDYDRALSPQHIVTYGSDPCVVGLVNLAWLDWFAGRVGAAMRNSDQAIALGRALSHGLSLAYALGMSAALYQCLGDAPRTAALAEETIGLAEKHDFPYWVAWETGLLGWARTAQGEVGPGISMLQKGLADYRATGAELFSPYMLGLLAQVHLRARRFDDALLFCEEALFSGDRSDVHFFDAEIHRLKGECLLDDRNDVAGAQACFERAMTVARGQGARMLELRAALVLASLRRSRGEGHAARRMLSGTVGLFDEAETSTELAEARRLLSAWTDE